METYLSLEYAHRSDLPPGHEDEVRTPEVLVERFLDRYSEPGDLVFDPFAGYGTTLAVAEELGRVPVGVEYEPDRIAYVRERLDDPEHVRQGDALDLDPDALPTCDCLFTSPPFMLRSMDLDPMQNYAGRSSYAEYLDDIATVFERCRDVLAPGGHAVVDVVNVKYEGEVTPLAWDVADRVAESFRFDGEVVVTWTGDGSPEERVGTFGYGYDHSYCLVFERPDDYCPSSS